MAARRLRHLAIIPARGGSKRLPRKNLLPFRGRPILSYSLAAARSAGLFDRILVSTEDREIAEVAAAEGAEVAPRPERLATDGASVVEVCLDLLARLEAEGERFDAMTVLYATAPLRTAGDIAATAGLIEPGRCDFAMAVCEFAQPFHQGLRRVGPSELEPVFPDSVTKRAEPGRFYAGNGSTYSVSVAAFRARPTFYGPGLRGHVMPRERSVDIDEAEDLALAEFYAERLETGGWDGETSPSSTTASAT